MTPAQCLDAVIRPACRLLGSQYSDDRAAGQLLAIAMQESGLRYRRQIRGPARGWFQFELTGLQGVATHPKSQPGFRSLVSTLGYDAATVPELHAVLEHNDLLAAGCARLLLYTVPRPLPCLGEQDEAWSQYLESWRPGKPHRSRWSDLYPDVVRTVKGELG